MKKYSFLWSNTHPLYVLWANIRSYHTYADIPFNDAKDVIQVSHGNAMSCYMSVEDFERDIEAGKRFLDPGFVEQFLQDAHAQCVAHKKFYAQSEETDYSSLPDKELVVRWETLMDHFSRSVGYFRGSQEEPSRVLVDLVESAVSPEELSVLLVPSKIDVINQEAIDWGNILQTSFTQNAALTHLKKYPWLLQNAKAYDAAVEELAQRAQTGGEVPDIEKEKQELGKEQETLLTKHPDIESPVRTLQELAYLRAEVKSCWAATEYYALPILKEVAHRTGADAEDLMRRYRHEDILVLMREGRILNAEELKERNVCTLQILEKGKLTSVTGAQAEALVRERLGEWFSDGSDTHELKGVSARPGKVTARAYVLVTNDPVANERFRNSFTEGVMVTSMTQPNVLDIMRRASAIVTDEGGMLSHAAIVSREFGIPCVVGTKRATKVIRDGDLVEVDADTGTVRILERI